MKLTIPPLALLLLALVSILWSPKYPLPSSNVSSGINILGLLIGCIGVSLSIVSVLLFRKYSTTVNPIRFDKTSSLVDKNVYAWSRNPNYLGMLMVILGVALYLHAPYGLFAAGIFVLLINYIQIPKEEAFLLERFGTTYLNYTKRVRRWI